MTKPAPTLRAVSNTPDPPIDAPPPSYAYEAEQRRHILSRDWSTMWIIADKAKAISIRGGGRGKWM